MKTNYLCQNVDSVREKLCNNMHNLLLRQWLRKFSNQPVLKRKYGAETSHPQLLIIIRDVLSLLTTTKTIRLSANFKSIQCAVSATKNFEPKSDKLSKGQDIQSGDATQTAIMQKHQICGK